MTLEVPKSNLKSINLVLNRDFQYMETTPKYKKYTSEEVYDRALKFAKKLLKLNWDAWEYVAVGDELTRMVDKRKPEFYISWEAPITKKSYCLRIHLLSKSSIRVVLYKTKEFFEEDLDNPEELLFQTSSNYLYSDDKILEVETSLVIDNNEDFDQVFKNTWYICWIKEVKFALKEATETLKNDLPVYFSKNMEDFVRNNIDLKDKYKTDLLSKSDIDDIFFMLYLFSKRNKEVSEHMTRDDMLRELYNNMEKLVAEGIGLKEYEAWKVTMQKFSDTEVRRMLGESRKLLNNN